MVSDNSRIARMHIERSNDSYVVEISMWFNLIQAFRLALERVIVLIKHKHILTDRRQAFGLRTDAQAFRLVLERALVTDIIQRQLNGQSLKRLGLKKNRCTNVHLCNKMLFGKCL